jgi:hypothetical protein
MRLLAGVCLAALALTACSKPADKAREAGPVAAPKPPTPAGFATAPRLKPGLWEITVGGAPMKASSCIDEATQKDAAAMGQGMDRGNCTRNSWNRIPGGMAFEFDCTTNGTHMISKGTVTGDFNSAYRMESEVTGEREGQSFTHKQVIDAKYLGACPSGMKPGDQQVTVNGRTMMLPARRAPN